MASRWYEGFPMTILEAARFAKLMVAPDHGGFTEIIGRGDDAIGMLVSPGNSDSLSDAIYELWRSSSKTQQLGRKAYDKLKHTYSIDVVSAQWSKLLDKITR